MLNGVGSVAAKSGLVDPDCLGSVGLACLLCQLSVVESGLQFASDDAAEHRAKALQLCRGCPLGRHVSKTQRPIARLRLGLLSKAMTAQDVRKLQNRKNACLDTARS